MEEIIKEFLLKELECEAIVLFGSYARGTQNAESDVDIAIKPKKEINKKQLFELDMYREFLELNESRKMIIDRVKKGGDIYS